MFPFDLNYNCVVDILGSKLVHGKVEVLPLIFVAQGDAYYRLEAVWEFLVHIRHMFVFPD